MERGLEQNMMGEEISIPCVRFPNKGFTMTAPVKELELSNNVFKTFAYGTHVPAYLDGGLADLPIDDLRKIGWQPKAANLLFSLDGIKQAGESSTVVIPKVLDKAVADAMQVRMQPFK